MKFSALQRFTVLDYPGSVAAIAFTPGCQFRCGYCHNPEFVLPETVKQLEPSFIDEEAVIRFLETRRGLLDGLVVSGGEPTLHRGLPAFLRRVRAMGFRIKLDTNGALPSVVRTLLGEGLLDYVAMDIKTSLERYRELVGPCVTPEAIAESIDLIKQHAPGYEFRTTLIRELHDSHTMARLSELVSGAKRYRLQTFRPSITLDSKFHVFHSFSAQEMRDLSQQFSYVQDLYIDGAAVHA